MDKRTLKDLLYEHVARIGKAVSSPKRLEILELLAQGEKSVDALANELSIDIKLTSAHLKALKDARLVSSRREGKFMVYQLSGADVAGLWVNLRQGRRRTSAGTAHGPGHLGGRAQPPHRAGAC
jgi:DNA-binding transcriptional ArsR family regulator